MKILLANSPVVKYNGEFKNIEYKLKINKLYKKLKTILGKGLYNILPLPFKSGFEYGVRAGSRWPYSLKDIKIDGKHGGAPYPFIMGYSAAILKNNGFDVEMLDAVVSGIHSYKKFLKIVKKSKADIVILECSTPTINIDLYLANEISKFCDVALAGPHLTDLITIDLMKNNPNIKYFLKGEYILSSLKMAQTLQKGIYENEVVKNINDIPFPYRDYCDAEKYFDPTMPTAKPQLQIYASKGCPFKCKYCVWPQVMYKGNVTLREPKLIAQEIRENVEKYGYKSIFFDDDTFNIGNERISELCDYLKEIGLPWTMMGRLDCSPDWLFDKMVACGCVGMRFGVESFNIDVLKNINKGLERIDFLKTIKHLSESYPDLYIHLTMMKNLPGQTEEIHQNDMKILKELGYSIDNIKRSYQLASCVPFPGTQLYKELVEKYGEERLKNWEKYNGATNTIMMDFCNEK